MTKKFIYIFIFSLTILFFCNTNIYALDSLGNDSFDSAAYAQKLINQGVGSNLGDKIINGGYMGEDAFTHDAKHFCYTFFKNNQMYIAENTNRFKSDDPYYQGLHDIFVGIVNEMKNSEDMKFFLKKLETYQGMNDDEYAGVAIEKICLEIFYYRVQEITKAYEKGCDDKSKGTFTYLGKQYDCDKIHSQYVNYEKYYGYEFLGLFTESLLKTSDNSLNILGGNITDTMAEQVRDDNYKVTGNESADIQKPSDTDDNGEFVFSYNPGTTNYIPRLVNAVKFANDFADAGQLESLTGTNGETSSLNDAIKVTIDEFSQLGLYVLFGTLLIFGVRTIWSGVHGKTQFKETLPYILLAIVFFYLAPKLVGLAEETFKLQYDMQKYNESLFATIVYVVRVVAFAGILFTGVKLMFSSASGRADVKKSLIGVLVGCIFVFASSLVVTVVVEASNEAGLEDIQSPSSNGILIKEKIYKI